MGETQELKISPQGARRILVGLSWNDGASFKGARTPRSRSKLLDLLLLPYTLLAGLANFALAKAPEKYDDAPGRDKNSSAYDLDLCCYAYDAAGKLVAAVTADTEQAIDASGSIYHSGDNVSGHGGEDEQIHVETAKLPAHYQHLFFVAVSDSKYTLDQFSAISLRLADSKTNGDFLEASPVPQASEKAYGYAFVHVFRDGDGFKFEPLRETAGDIDWAASFAERLQAS